MATFTTLVTCFLIFGVASAAMFFPVHQRRLVRDISDSGAPIVQYSGDYNADPNYPYGYPQDSVPAEGYVDQNSYGYPYQIDNGYAYNSDGVQAAPMAYGSAENGYPSYGGAIPY